MMSIPPPPSRSPARLSKEQAPDRPRRRVLTHEPHVTRGLVERLKLARYLGRFDEQHVWAAFMFINGFLTIALLAILAVVTHNAFVFPSLGPTAYLFFFDPHSPAASPRNAMIGHAIGLICGYLALLAFGLQHSGSAMSEGVGWPRALAAALSLASTGAVMILMRVSHPPAGATTLIVSLGVVTSLSQLVIIEVAVAVLVVQAIVINRLAGLDYPLWSHHVPHDQVCTLNDRRGRKQPC